MNTSAMCEIRKRHGWTQSLVAEAMGIKNVDVSAAENGRSVLVPPRVIELALRHIEEHPEILGEGAEEANRRMAERTARDEAIVEARRAGRSLRSVAAEFGVSAEWVRRLTDRMT